MAEVKPFKGFFYNKDKVGDIADVTAPPYDVISDGLRDQLYDKNEHNIIRLILGRSFIGDDERNNKYIRAGKTVKEWIKEGVLARDSMDSFYVYLQEYGIGGRICRRIGFMGLMRIEGDDMVVPHEHTLANPKEDRMNLVKEVESNLSPIFSLYDDTEKQVTAILEKIASEKAPLTDIEVDGVVHRLWSLSDKDLIGKIVSGMKGKKVFIADGHHRYEVARAYRDMMRKREGYDGRADHVMMYFTDMSDPKNLTILATHRALKKAAGLSTEAILEKLGRYFSITGLVSADDLMNAMTGRSGSSYVYGLMVEGSNFMLEPLDPVNLRGIIRADKSDEWKSMDVSVLHSAVLENILGIESCEENITYVKDAASARRLVDHESHAAAFLLNPTKIGQLKAVAEKGEMMPQKSTYFHPKLLTGLVINRFGGDPVTSSVKKEEG